MRWAQCHLQDLSKGKWGSEGVGVRNGTGVKGDDEALPGALKGNRTRPQAKEHGASRGRKRQESGFSLAREERLQEGRQR